MVQITPSSKPFALPGSLQALRSPGSSAQVSWGRRRFCGALDAQGHSNCMHDVMPPAPPSPDSLQAELERPLLSPLRSPGFSAQVSWGRRRSRGFRGTFSAPATCSRDLALSLLLSCTHACMPAPPLTPLLQLLQQHPCSPAKLLMHAAALLPCSPTQTANSGEFRALLQGAGKYLRLAVVALGMQGLAVVLRCAALRCSSLCSDLLSLLLPHRLPLALAMHAVVSRRVRRTTGRPSRTRSINGDS